MLRDSQRQRCLWTPSHTAGRRIQAPADCPSPEVSPQFPLWTPKPLPGTSLEDGSAAGSFRQPCRLVRPQRGWRRRGPDVCRSCQDAGETGWRAVRQDVWKSHTICSEILLRGMCSSDRLAEVRNDSLWHFLVVTEVWGKKKRKKLKVYPRGPGPCRMEACPVSLEPGGRVPCHLSGLGSSPSTTRRCYSSGVSLPS